MHVDINSYFATMEQQAYPNLRGQPIGVAGKGKGERTVVCGASIEAKKFGVRSGMSVWEARDLCPELVIIPASYDRYSFTSRRIFNLLERFSPKVEIFSIDEAFLELPTQTNLQSLNPKQIENLKNQISKRWDLGLGAWDFNNPENWAYLDAAITALQIKRLIRAKIGQSVGCSVGISYGRTLAKLASERQKPNGLTIIRPEDFSKIADVTPIEELCGIGWALRGRLNRLGVATIADLGQMPKYMLTTVFGTHTGEWLHNIGNGLDDDVLRSWRAWPREKSIGHSYTLPRDLTDLNDVKKVLLLLAERVGVRLRAKHLVGRTVSIWLRFRDGSGWGERHTQKEYLLDGYQIYRSGERLLNNLDQSKPIRLVSISISDLINEREATAPLFPANQANEQLTGAVDKINRKFGEQTVYRALIHQIRSRIFNLPDGRDKRRYLPEISPINPFTKRV